MQRKILSAACLIVALAACSKSGEQANGAATAGKASGSTPAPVALKLNPGLWETSVDMTMSGVPANVAAMMKGTKLTTRSCITPDQANRPSGEIFSGKKEKGCTYSDYDVSGGSIHGKMSCDGSNGRGPTSMVMDGHYGGDSFDVSMKVDTKEAGQSVAMSWHTTARRIGECSADAKKG
jgi:hypothetical protein